MVHTGKRAGGVPSQMGSVACSGGLEHRWLLPARCRLLGVIQPSQQRDSSKNQNWLFQVSYIYSASLQNVIYESQTFLYKHLCLSYFM